jgi:hypothetical protein
MGVYGVEVPADGEDTVTDASESEAELEVLSHASTY